FRRVLFRSRTASAHWMSTRKPCAAPLANALPALQKRWRANVARKKKPLPSLEWLKPRVKISRAISMASFIGLAVLLLVWNLVFAELYGARTWVVISIQLVPRLLAAPRLIAGSHLAHACICFIVIECCFQGVLVPIDPSRIIYGWLQAILSLTVFISSFLSIR